MSLSLTPDSLEAMYDCLRAFPPFSKWKLPQGKDIHQFRVSKRKDQEGHYTRYVGTDKHIISISVSRIGHFNSLAQVMAHEMIHLKQGISKTETPNAVHNAEFWRIAKSVCKRFGWDEKTFV